LAVSPAVQLYFDIAGPFDVLLVVVVHDMDEYNAFTAEFLETEAVRRFETAMVKKRHKATLAAPID
jgi:DNA-binding Lrp family transcriptional regulator